MRTVGPEPQWLRDLRTTVHARLREQGATQVGLASHLAITQKHLSDVLTGKASGSPDLLARLAAAVGVRITITDTDDPRPVLPGRRKRLCSQDAPGYEQVIRIITTSGKAG